MIIKIVRTGYQNCKHQNNLFLFLENILIKAANKNFKHRPQFSYFPLLFFFLINYLAIIRPTLSHLRGGSFNHTYINHCAWLHEPSNHILLVEEFYESVWYFAIFILFIFSEREGIENEKLFCVYGSVWNSVW